MVICNIYYHISPQKTVKVFLLVYQHHFVNCLQSLIVFNAKKKKQQQALKFASYLGDFLTDRSLAMEDRFMDE